jgi:hypothetical protein
VVGKQYLTRQATTLLKFARTVTDPNVAAGLVEKAADLKSQVENGTGRTKVRERRMWCRVVDGRFRSRSGHNLNDPKTILAESKGRILGLVVREMEL